MRHAPVALNYETLAEDLSKVMNGGLPQSMVPEVGAEDEKIQSYARNYRRMTGRDPFKYVSGLAAKEPSFTRLFTHETWEEYTGRPSLERWLVVTQTWPWSTVLRTVFPISLLASIWAFCIASLPAALLPRTSPVPMSLMGTALGLLLVFRTNNSYLRLAEARTLWSAALVGIREIGQGVATALLWDKDRCQSVAARDGAARICRYLAAISWETRARLMGGEVAESTAVLEVLLPPEEVEFIAAQRIRPLQLLSALRRELHDQWALGHLPAHLHRKLEEDVREIDKIIGSFERLFSSPLPPTMSRHIVRCLQIWLLGFPFVLAGTMAPVAVALWVFATSYALVGIDEVGVQVEQPFDILPMRKLCTIVVFNLEESFVRLPPCMTSRMGLPKTES